MKTYKSTVLIEIYQEVDGEGLLFCGTGFFINHNGLMATAAHVVCEFNSSKYFGWNSELMKEPIQIDIEANNFKYGAHYTEKGLIWRDSAICKIQITSPQFYSISNDSTVKQDIVQVHSLRKVNDARVFGSVEFETFLHEYVVFSELIVKVEKTYKGGFSFIKGNSPYIEAGMSGSPIINVLGEAVGILIGGEGYFMRGNTPLRHANPLTSAVPFSEIFISGTDYN